ncbi:MFS transporter [Saccharopolyspora erythraea]|uniref:MFS transporter n=1 Tax=Saccharopolyspora erythraea TaxID=1836 RepID=UPI001BA93FE5|nr:MFS transporter [Saccharopolyspora erythraea]QUH01844.1 MFS transporter [Saccharopolyspora erythraea]
MAKEDGSARPPARSAFAFWSVAAAMAFALAASAVPSPLYVDYQAQWKFSAATLTAVYATYAAGVVVALLLAGGLSDRVGRRPVLVVSIAGLVVSLLLFVFADGVGWLYAARGLQGLATGVFTGAAGGALAELHPRSDHRFAATVNSTSTSAGIAAGAVVAGALAEFVPFPLRAPYVLLVVIALVLLSAIAWRVPETVERSGGEAGFRVQRLKVPAEIRGQFVLASLGVFAAWAVAGLYLGLGGSIAKELLQVDNHLVVGLVILSMQGVGGLAQLVFTRMSNASASIVGSTTLIAGLLVTAVSLPLLSPVVFFGGAITTGVGFGLTFMGATRRVVHAAPAHARGETLAAYFVVAYVAISAPVVVAGFVAAPLGLATTFYLFAATIGLAAASMLVGTLVRR